jgi:hypothetical protein
MMAAPETTIHPMAALMRRFAVDWLDRADPSVPPQIMAPGYTIHIGGVVMEGLAEYTEATSGQLARFPGLTITVHDVLYGDGDRAALLFTEHGASVRGGAAAWRGIGLFRAAGGIGAGLLVHNVVEEDYLARRRQLLAGTTDAVDPPMVAPWTEPVGDPDPDAEKAVRAWLDAGGPVATEGGLTCDDGAAQVLDVVSCEVGELFSAGGRVAFQAVQRGRYVGGLPDVEAANQDVELSVVGIVEPAAGGSVTGHVVRDRLGLLRKLGAR